MNLLKIGCRTMREGVVVAAIFFFAGILMILAGTKIVPDIFYMQHIVMLAGLAPAAFRTAGTDLHLPAQRPSGSQGKAR